MTIPLTRSLQTQVRKQFEDAYKMLTFTLAFSSAPICSLLHICYLVG